MMKPGRALRHVLEKARLVADTVDASSRLRATELTAYEVTELENVFVLLLLGSFAGIPSPPTFIALELLPHLEHEIGVLKSRAENASDALAEVTGVLGID